MKKIKFLLLACTILLLSGCVVASYDITINEDDTGKALITIAHVDSDGDGDWENITNEISNATTEDITFEKNGQMYVGKKAVVSFSSIDELNEIFLSFSDDSDDSDDSDEQNGTADAIKIVAKREGNKVLISSEADPEEYEQSKMFLDAIDFKFSLKTAGIVSTHNAKTVENGTYNWDYATLLKDGINFEYVTETNTSTDLNDSADHNYIILGIIGAIAITIVALSIACINTVIISKKKQI